MAGNQTPQRAPFSLTLPWGMTVYVEYVDNQPHLGVRDDDDDTYVQTALTPEAMRIVAAELTRMAGAEPPAAEPGPFWLKDIVGDEVGVNSLPGQARISLSVDDIMWLDPDEADQLADALKAHAAARRADVQGSTDA